MAEGVLTATSTVAAANPYATAQHQFDQAASILGLDEGLRQVDAARRKKVRERPRLFVAREAEEPGPEEERGRRDAVDREIPVEKRRRGARVIRENGRIHREPQERSREEPPRPPDETAVRDAPEEPGEGRAEKRPAERQPLSFELERDRDRDERQNRSRHKGDARAVLSQRNAERQQTRKEHREAEGERERQETHHAPIAALRESRAKEWKEDRARENGRLLRLLRPFRALPEDERVCEENEPEGAAEEQLVLPEGGPAPVRELPGIRGRRRGQDRQDREPLRARARREREERDEKHDVRREKRAQWRRAAGERDGDRHRFGQKERDRRPEREGPVLLPHPRPDAEQREGRGRAERADGPGRARRHDG